jgi:hypothetical protein
VQRGQDGRGHAALQVVDGQQGEDVGGEGAGGGVVDAGLRGPVLQAQDQGGDAGGPAEMREGSNFIRDDTIVTASIAGLGV